MPTTWASEIHKKGRKRCVVVVYRFLWCNLEQCNYVMSSIEFIYAVTMCKFFCAQSIPPYEAVCLPSLAQSNFAVPISFSTLVTRRTSVPFKENWRCKVQPPFGCLSKALQILVPHLYEAMRILPPIFSTTAWFRQQKEGHWGRAAGDVKRMPRRDSAWKR